MTRTTGELLDCSSDREKPYPDLSQSVQTRPDEGQRTRTTSLLVHLLTRAVNSTPQKPRPSQFHFRNTVRAAQVNYVLLKNNDFDLAKDLRNETNTVTSPAYEFRSGEVIELLLQLSSDASKLKSICFDGIRYPFPQDVDLSDPTQIEDAKYWLQKGNNKSAGGKRLSSRTLSQRKLNEDGRLRSQRQHAST